MFRCPICGAYTRGNKIDNDIEEGICTKCGKLSKVRFWHYFDETGEAVCGIDVVSCNGVV